VIRFVSDETAQFFPRKIFLHVCSRSGVQADFLFGGFGALSMPTTLMPRNTP